MSRTFGASCGAFGPGMIVQSATDWSIVRPIVPPKFLSGIGSTVRSGTNLPIASARPSLSAFRPFLSVCTIDFASAPGSACSTASRCESSNAAMIPAVPAGRFSPILSCISVSSRLSTNFPTRPPATAPAAVTASSGGAARPTRTPTPPPHSTPLRPRWSAVCATVTEPSSACVIRIAASISTFLSSTSFDERVEVLDRRRRCPGSAPTRTSVGVSAITPLLSVNSV